jgi:hypothetical protein
MPRKSKQLKQEEKAAAERLAEIQKLKALAEEEDARTLKEVAADIDKLCENHNLSCGLILDKDSVMQLIHAFIYEGKEKITVKYNLYFKETE